MIDDIELRREIKNRIKSKITIIRSQKFVSDQAKKLLAQGSNALWDRTKKEVAYNLGVEIAKKVKYMDIEGGELNTLNLTALVILPDQLNQLVNEIMAIIKYHSHHPLVNQQLLEE